MKNQDSFSVDREGFRQLQAGREPWTLAKELISNSFDEESVGRITVSLTKQGKAFAVFKVTDDGNGFSDISDAWTLYAFTEKRDNPNVRGRFNLGEKEIIAMAREAKIETTTGWVAWDRQGKRSQGHKSRKRGTVVTLKLNWIQAECDEVIQKLKQLVPPTGKVYVVNGNTVLHRKPIESFNVSLPTVLFNRKTGGLSPTVRITSVLTYHVLTGENATLMEMGIAVQDIDTPFHISVEQKIPLSPHRNSVAPAYLQDVYAETLNSMVLHLTQEEAAEGWVDKALTDKRTKDEAVKAVMQARYPKTVIWTPNSLANERARDRGLQVVHPRGLDKVVVARFRKAGLETTQEKFGIETGKDDAEPLSKPIPEDEWTVEMHAFRGFAKALGKILLIGEPEVVYANLRRVRNADFLADFGDGTLRIYVNKVGKDFFKFIPEFGFDARQIGILVHEFAHHVHRDGDEPHGTRWKDELEIMAGQTVRLALENPELFDYKRYL